jgi:hypothetical protein
MIAVDTTLLMFTYFRAVIAPTPGVEAVFRLELLHMGKVNTIIPVSRFKRR